MKKPRGLLPFLCLAILLALTSCETKSTIANNLSERDANEAVVLLSSKGIPASKTPAPAAAVGGTSTEVLWDLVVPGEFVTQALSVLNQAGLPRKKQTTLLDLFGSQGLVPSDLQDRIRYQEGLSDQLSNTIRKMEGVIDADVQISFPQGEEEQKKELSASVYVKHRGILDNPNSILVTKIKRLVSSSVPGLKIENVSVVTDRAVTADIVYPPMSKEGSELGEVVSVWGVYLSKQSLTLFRAIFYSFLFLTFILISIALWLTWKFSEIIKARGILSLFSLEPYAAEEKKEEKPTEEASV